MPKKINVLCVMVAMRQIRRECRWHLNKPRQSEKESLSAKHLDKELAASDSGFRELTFDLQAVLYMQHAGEQAITKLITRENWRCTISQCTTATVTDIVSCGMKQREGWLVG